SVPRSSIIVWIRCILGVSVGGGGGGGSEMPWLGSHSLCTVHTAATGGDGKWVSSVYSNHATGPRGTLLAPKGTVVVDATVETIVGAGTANVEAWIGAPGTAEVVVDAVGGAAPLD